MEQLLVWWIRSGCQHRTQLWDLPARSIICLWIKDAFWWSSANLPKGMRARAIGTEKSPGLVRCWWPQIVTRVFGRRKHYGFILLPFGVAPFLAPLNGAPFDYNYSALKLAICNKSENELLRYYSELPWCLMSVFCSHTLATLLCFVCIFPFLPLSAYFLLGMAVEMYCKLVMA